MAARLNDIGIQLRKFMVVSVAAILAMVEIDLSNHCVHESIRIAVWIFFVPGPGGGDDVFQLRIFRFPAQFADGFFGGRDQPGGSPGRRGFSTAGIFLPVIFSQAGMTAARNSRRRCPDLKAALARPRAEDVRLRQVDDVDVIADAGAVGRRIIRAENIALRFLAERDLKHVRNEMRLDAMMFAEFFARAGGVEIAERDEFQPVNLLVPVRTSRTSAWIRRRD